jgi:hypothetical protein
VGAAQVVELVVMLADRPAGAVEVVEAELGKGIDLARPHAPEHAQVLDDFKDQLLIALVRRLGGVVDMPVAEVDDTGSVTLALSVNDRTFHFEVRKKQ